MKTHELKKSRVFQDSGAFSADAQGTAIDINEYMAFLTENKDRITVYANLDVIGDAVATWENQKIMEDNGFTPLPVFHSEDDFKYLDKCLEYKYFCLGGLAGGSTTAQRRDFLDNCFIIICDKDGYPKSKVHGFGMASPELLHRYPFYSFDSSSWASYGRFGVVIVPKMKKGKYRYDCPPLTVFVSERSTRKGIDGQHFYTLSIAEQQSFMKYVKSKNLEYGESIIFDVNADYVLQENEKFSGKEKRKVERMISPGICNVNFQRDFLNHCFYEDMAANHSRTTFKYKGLTYLF